MSKQVDKLVDTVYAVQNRTGYRFDVMDVFDILRYTIHKAEVNGKGEDYIPILFETELEDHIMRKRINKIGGRKPCVSSV